MKNMPKIKRLDQVFSITNATWVTLTHAANVAILCKCDWALAVNMKYVTETVRGSVFSIKKRLKLYTVTFPDTCIGRLSTGWGGPIKPLKLTIAQIAVNSNIFAIMACVAIVLQQCAIFILLADYLVLFSCKIAQFSYQIENCRHVLFGFCLIIDPNCS